MQLKSVYRITVFVPHDALRAVIDTIKTICPLGDEHYDSVLWYLEDVREEFRPLPGAKPARGDIGDLHQEPVAMLIFAIPRDENLLRTVIEQGVKPKHPWEEPGIFVEASLIPE